MIDNDHIQGAMNSGSNTGNERPDGDLKRNERRSAGARDAALREIVERRGFASVADIAGELGVSDITIRRDLTRLESQGFLVRTHGGAIAAKGVPAEAFDIDEPTFDARRRRNADAKDRIGAAAAALVRAGETIGIDVGTTTLQVARHLANRPDIKIFTNNVRAATVLAEGPAHCYLPGGQLRGKELSIYGSIAIEQLRRYWLDRVFLGISGVTDQGVFDYSLEDTEIKRVYIERATQVVVLCDSSKFGRLSMVRIDALDAIDLLITNGPPPADLREALEAAAVEIIIANGATRSEI